MQNQRSPFDVSIRVRSSNRPPGTWQIRDPSRPMFPLIRQPAPEALVAPVLLPANRSLRRQSQGATKSPRQIPRRAERAEDSSADRRGSTFEEAHERQSPITVVRPANLDVDLRASSVFGKLVFIPQVVKSNVEVLMDQLCGLARTGEEAPKPPQMRMFPNASNPARNTSA